MQMSALPLNQHLQDGYLLSLEKARKKFAKADPLEMADNSGAVFDQLTQCFSLTYLYDTYRITYPQGLITYTGHQKEVAVTTKIVLLHYLIKASGLPLTGTLISFKELPDGGMIYYEPFAKRVILGLTYNFGKNAGRLAKAGEYLGGRSCKIGSGSVTLDVLPKVPVTYIVWEGDDEVPSKATALFDASVRYYLPTEDLVVATSAGSSLLSKTAKSMIQEK